MSPLPVRAAMQGYLEVIFDLSCQIETVRVTDIAKRLKLSKASVSQALDQLREQGINYQNHYGPVQ